MNLFQDTIPQKEQHFLFQKANYQDVFFKSLTLNTSLYYVKKYLLIGESLKRFINFPSILKVIQYLRQQPIKGLYQHIVKVLPNLEMNY